MIELLAQTLPSVPAGIDWMAIGKTVGVVALAAIWTDFRGWLRENRSKPRVDRTSFDWQITLLAALEVAVAALIVSLGGSVV